ncbi:hypothetical protein EYM_05340 [Ignicoccus islandicus DSM 13165]|uniref:Uncharacterized protein n=1 Tax=Ignicoccus islandicus DSM 13165 TaxID=940295 RepID=A0A0U2WNP8_9CREN|nr:hypothetical protein EYM_05340 [Ignicoccus islandicus DSM 13165]
MLGSSDILNSHVGSLFAYASLPIGYRYCLEDESTNKCKEARKGFWRSLRGALECLSKQLKKREAVYSSLTELSASGRGLLKIDLNLEEIEEACSQDLSGSWNVRIKLDRKLLPPR